MARKGITLIGEPVEHGLSYCSCFFKKLPSPGNVDKKETNGTAVEDDRVLDNDDPRAFYHVGHGAAHLFSVECRDYYINSHTGQRMDKFSDRVVHLMSCITGQELGPALISHGASAYLGYTDLFYYGCWKSGTPMPAPCDPPTSNADLYTFGDSDVEAERRFIEQATIGEAKAASQSKFDEYITRYATGDWKDRYIAPLASRLLRHDKDEQIQLGDSSAKLGTTKEVLVTILKGQSIFNVGPFAPESEANLCKVRIKNTGKDAGKCYVSLYMKPGEPDESKVGQVEKDIPAGGIADAVWDKVAMPAEEGTYKFGIKAWGEAESEPDWTETRRIHIWEVEVKLGWSPLHWAVTTVESTRPKVPVEPIESAVAGAAKTILEAAPRVKMPGKPPPPPPETLKWG